MKISRTLLVHFLLITGACAMVMPFIWMTLTSIKTFGDSTLVPPVIFPEKIQWENYVKVFQTLPFADYYRNTIVTTVLKTLGQLLLCSSAAYAFARISFPARNVLFALTMSVIMVPHQVYLIPQYLMMAKLGWLDTLKAIIAPGVFSVFGTFLLRQFFLTLPRELEEAAKLDGCNHFRIYLYIMIPLAKPGLITLAVFACLWSWNDLMWPLIVLHNPHKMTLSVGLATLQGEFMTDFPVLMAGAMLATWPMIVLFILLQRYFVEGIALSGTKG